VMATGAWSPRLRMLTRGSRLCVESGRGYSVDLARHEREQIVRPLLLHEPRVAVTPFHGRLRLAGTMALDGLDPRIDPARVRAVHDVGRRAFEKWNDADIVQVWSGPRPCTPDGVPLVGWLADQEGSVAIATGHAMLGLTLAPSRGASSPNSSWEDRGR
jgi:D-amino-acid dehydrogenase